MKPRIGFCCKYVAYSDQYKPELLEADLNQVSTTLTALRRLDKSAQIQKIFDIANKNCQVLWNQLNYLAALPAERRLFRITSTFLPAFTASDLKSIYSDPAIKNLLEVQLGPVREFTERYGIRLCSHPGQYTVLSSLKPEVVEASIEDLEYHAYLAELMGFGDSWHSCGFAINIHANNNIDPGLVRFLDIFQTRLSKTLQNLLTIENDEFSCNVDDLVASRIGDHIALVLDIHHHWIASKGEYIAPDDPRIDCFKNSWRGQRPLGHFSTSQQSELQSLSFEDLDKLPNYKDLIANGGKVRDLRKHSNNCWNMAVNRWALSHMSWTDLEVEAKGKNWAAQTLYLQGVLEGVIEQPVSTEELMSRFKPLEAQ
jgi:UV DNA damage repair endonuclease